MISPRLAIAATVLTVAIAVPSAMAAQGATVKESRSTCAQQTASSIRAEKSPSAGSSRAALHPARCSTQ